MIKLVKSPGYPYVWINTSDALSPSLIRAIDLQTSFMIQNPQHAIRAYEEKQRENNRKRIEQNLEPLPIKPWDGRVRLLKQSSKNKSYYFPIGLIDDVVKVLRWTGIEPDTSLRFTQSGITLAPFEWRGPPLRNYQINAFIEAMKRKRCILYLPTGSGKTLIGMKLMCSLSKPSLILVNRKELATQWIENIEKISPELPVRMFNADAKSFGIITVAMVQSLNKWLQKKDNHLPAIDVLILDEAHHTPADTFFQIAMKCDAEWRFGLTATPQREDGADVMMNAALGPIAVKIEADELIKSGHLALPRFEFIKLPVTLVGGKNFAAVYKNGIVMNTERNKIIAARVRQLVQDGRQVYVHVEQILHGEILSKLLNAPFVYSKSKDREETIKTFKNGFTKVLISTLLGEGVDIPQISAIVMAGGRKTKSGTIQKVGRALRPIGSHADAIIVDFVDIGKHLSQHATQRYQAYCEVYGKEYVNRFYRMDVK